MSFVPVKLKGREVEPYKAVVRPLIGERTVLTNSPWTYVGLWLRREKKLHALFYWEQAQQFHQVSVGLSLRTAPLLLYYCYMNAVKALLSAKGAAFDEWHGTKALNPGRRGTFYTEGVSISTRGILPSLITYYGESETARRHTLQQLLFNMVFIHRSYALTFTSQQEMYLPLTNCVYKVERATRRVFLTAKISARVPLNAALNRIPPNFVSEPRLGERSIRSISFAQFRHTGRYSSADFQKIAILNAELRTELRYICGVETLWYLRLRTKHGPGAIDRQTPTMILAAMHRLSEICRYRPLELEALLSGQKNWLLSEFIAQSPTQFIDEIASEITGFPLFLQKRSD